MNYVRSALLTLSVTAAFVACSTRDTNDGDAASGADNLTGIVLPVIEDDSNGVQQLTFPPDAFSRVPQFTMDSVPVAVAGGANGTGEFDLTWVNLVHVLSDNRLVAFANIGASLLVFGADGSEERVIGRLGRGPGEFTRPGGVSVLPGDTLFLSDVPNNRLNWVLPDGQFVRTSTIQWERLRNNAESVAGVLPDGRLILHSAGRVESTTSDTAFRSAALVEVQPITGARQSIASIPDLAELTVLQRVRGRDQRINKVLSFTPRARIKLWDTLVTTSQGDVYRISMRAPSGTLLREISIPLRRRPVTQQMKDDAIATALAAVEMFRSEGEGNTYTKDEQRANALLTPSADSLPLIQDLFVTPNGTLWVLDNAAESGTDGQMLTAYRSDGAMLGRLRIPDDARPMAFGNDRVVLRVLDEDDVVALHVHSVRTTSRAGPRSRDVLTSNDLRLPVNPIPLHIRHVQIV